MWDSSPLNGEPDTGHLISLFAACPCPAGCRIPKSFFVCKGFGEQSSAWACGLGHANAYCGRRIAPQQTAPHLVESSEESDVLWRACCGVTAAPSNCAASSAGDADDGGGVDPWVRSLVQTLHCEKEASVGSGSGGGFQLAYQSFSSSASWISSSISAKHTSRVKP